MKCVFTFQEYVDWMYSLHQWMFHNKTQIDELGGLNTFELGTMVNE